MLCDCASNPSVDLSHPAGLWHILASSGLMCFISPTAPNGFWCADDRSWQIALHLKLFASGPHLLSVEDCILLYSTVLVLLLSKPKRKGGQFAGGPARVNYAEKTVLYFTLCTAARWGRKTLLLDPVDHSTERKLPRLLNFLIRCPNPHARCGNQRSQSNLIGAPFPPS